MILAFDDGMKVDKRFDMKLIYPFQRIVFIL